MRILKYGWQILIGIQLIIILSIILSIYLRHSPPPLKEIAEARKNITKAKKSHSAKYAESTFKLAKTLYDSAMYQWQIENDRTSPIKNYEDIKRLAKEASRLAIASEKKAISVSSSMKTMAQMQIENLQNQLDLYDKVYSRVPLNSVQIQNFSEAKLYHQEGIQAVKNGYYKRALERLAAAEQNINFTISYSRAILEAYFENHSTWKRLVDMAIEESRKNRSYYIIVDKYARNCLLYKNGVLKNTYQAELGSNWIGDKVRQGDKSTPEGNYKVTSKKSDGETRYYKALLINYPNQEDKKRFELNKKNGVISSNTDIGGLIEIHGHGGKGIDWTDGCIALNDRDMDDIYSVSQVGVNILIVGSIRPLDQIVK